MRLDLVERDALVEALQLGQVGFAERERRGGAQAGPRRPVEIEVHAGTAALGRQARYFL